MNGWILYDQAQYDRNRWFADALTAHAAAFCDARLVLVERLRFGLIDGRQALRYEGAEIDFPDFAISRTIFPTLSFFLEQNGVRVFNSGAISAVCNDKRATYAAVAKTKVPILDTAFYDRRFFSADSLAGLAYPCVVKSVDGHGGKEVFLADGPDSLLESVNGFHSNGFLIQDVCRTRGKDLRVYVMGGKIIGAALRTAEQFKSNYSLGGSASAYRLSGEETGAVDAVLACLPGVPDFVGIDFLLDSGGLIFNEVEDVVGTRMLYKTTDLDAAALYAGYIKTKLSGH